MTICGTIIHGISTHIDTFALIRVHYEDTGIEICAPGNLAPLELSLVDDVKDFDIV